MSTVLLLLLWKLRKCCDVEDLVVPITTCVLFPGTFDCITIYLILIVEHNSMMRTDLGPFTFNLIQYRDLSC